MCIILNKFKFQQLAYFSSFEYEIWKYVFYILNKLKFPKSLLKKSPLQALLGSSRNTPVEERCVTIQVTDAGYFLRIYSDLNLFQRPWLNAVLFMRRTKCKRATVFVFAHLHFVRLMKSTVFNSGQTLIGQKKMEIETIDILF